MPIWRDVQYLTIHFGWKFERNSHKNWLGVEKENIDEFNLAVPYQDFHAQMKKIIEDVRDHQYEIKAVMPLTEAICMSEISNNRETSWGYGYGTSTIVGYGIIVQKEIELSQEEYDARKEKADAKIALRDAKAQKADLTKKLEVLQKELDHAKGLQREMIEKKGLLGGIKYRIVGLEYSDKAEAQAIIDKNIAAYENALANLNAAKEELAQAEDKINVFSQKLEEWKQ